jgi:tetratricopeptide (TPR) repeat protein
VRTATIKGVLGMGSLSRKARALGGLALLTLGSVLAAVWVEGPSDPDRLASGARLALSDRQWSRADALLTRLARLRPPTSDDRVLRAELELGRGRPDQAISLLTAIPETDPLAARARLLAGQIEKSRDRARRMEALFRDALRLDPKLALARRQLIFLYSMQARRAEVQAQYRALAELEPLNYEDVFLWTNSFENLWINHAIQPHLERYLAADPDDRISRLALAEVFVRYHQLEESEALLRGLPDSDPDVRVVRARIALGRLRLDEARSILAEGPAEHLGLALLRGHFAVRSHDPATAAQQFRIALRQDPTNLEALEEFSTVLRQLGDQQAAASVQRQVQHWRHLRTLLQKATTFHLRTDKTLLTQLGETCEDLGQRPEARAWYQLALAQDPLDPAVQKSLYRLRDRAPAESPVGPGRERDR